MLEFLPHIIVILASFAGLALTVYIRRKKTTHESMVCPLNGHCESVINSEYSKFLGIPVELLGMAYYIVLIISYSVFIVSPSMAHPLIVFAVFAASTGAVCFSGYLTFIQIFSLKQLCTWCLTSASLCVIIFFSAIFASETGFIPVLIRNLDILLVIQMMGLALGVGGATVADVLFIKFLKDFRISESESDVLKAVYQIIWLAMAILVVSGLSIFLTDTTSFANSAVFTLQTTVLGVLIFNASILTLLVSPRMLNISLSINNEQVVGELRSARRLSLIMSGVSLASWYTLLIITTLSSINISFIVLLIIYVIALITAIVAGQIIERNIDATNTN